MSLVRKYVSRITAISLTSRAVVFFLQLAFNILVPDHESRDAFRVPAVSSPSFFDKVIAFSCSGLNHWDAQYFIHVTENRYDTEEKLVFLPVFPLSLRIPAHLINSCSFNRISPQSAVMISALVLNTVFFTMAAIALFKLTLLVFKESKVRMAEEVVLWFAFNPASIFFSATYCESLFSFLTFSGLCFWENEQLLVASLFFGLSAMTRSNGLVSSGFFLYFAVRSLTDRSKSHAGKAFAVLKSLLCTAIVILPFYAYQRLYIPKNFCPSSAFCSQLEEGSIFTIPYSILQETYWNQGFLRYWQLKQIPNFLIGLPIITLSLWSACLYFPRIQNSISENEIVLFGHKFWAHVRLVPYAAEVLFLAMYCLLFMHVQVAVRLLSSSSPWIYWMSAQLETNTGHHNFVRSAFISYFFIGIALFANGLPWT